MGGEEEKEWRFEWSKMNLRCTTANEDGKKLGMIEREKAPLPEV